MKKLLSTGALALCLGFAAYTIADERPDHFKGKPAETLSAAVTNFSDYNKQLAAVLAKDSLEPTDMVRVHELTYTLENALEKLREELDDLADVLEEVHVASERMDANTVKSQGQKYLGTAQEIIR